MAPDAQSFQPTSAFAPSSTAGSDVDNASSKEAILAQHGLHAKELARVMAKNESWAFPASEDGWIKAHDAVRADMRDIGLALDAVVSRLQQGQAVQPWVVANLQAYWPMFEELVHHHHDNEEHIIMPELAKLRCVMPAKMSTDHVGLMKAMDELAASVKALRPGATVSTDLATFTVLRAKFEAMRRDMEEHLLEEEEVCLPIMRKGVTQKQFKPIEKMIIAKASPALVGWILRPFPSDQARRQWMTEIAGIPGLVQSLVMMPAAKKFRNKWSQMVEEVKAGERIAPEPSGCFGLF